MKSSSNFFIIGGILFYILVFIMFYPPIYAIMDEGEYFDFAYRLKEGNIYADRLYGHLVVPVKDKYVSMYPIGTSLLLLPFTFIHWKALFLLNPIMHIIGFLFFYKSLKIVKQNTIFSLLYLFYPSYIYHSRTLMSEIPSVALIVIGFYFYIKGNIISTDKDIKWSINYLMAGVFMGISGLIRNTNLLIFLCFVIVIIIKFISIKDNWKIKIKNFLKVIFPFFIGGLLIIFVITWYNYIIYKNSLITGYSFAVDLKSLFDSHYLIEHLFYYISSLTLIYPLMLFGIFFYHYKEKAEIIFTSITFIIIWSFWYYIDGKIFIEKIIRGIRYLLPITPLFLISYPFLYEKLLGRFKLLYKLGLIFIITIAIIGCVVISYKHQNYLRQQMFYRDTIYENTTEGSLIICNGEVPEHLQKIWGDRKYIRFEYTPNDTLEKYINQNKDNYLITILRPDKIFETELAKKRTDEFMKIFETILIKEIPTPYQLKIYKIVK